MGRFSGYLFASDLDGTLFDSKKRISDRNKRTIEWFVNEGGLFTIATGRTKNSSLSVLNALPINAPALLFQGTVLWDKREERSIRTYELDNLDREELIGDLHRLFPTLGMDVYRLDTSYMVYPSEYGIEHFRIIGEEIKLTPLSEVPEDGWIKLFFTQEPDILSRVENYLRERYGERYGIAFSQAYYLEMFSPKADKASSLMEVADRMGVSRDKICVAGDHLNDLTMLKAAHYAFVPVNGHPEAKALATRVVDDNDKGAVASAIEVLDRLIG